jgi:hypothetical protein
MGNAPMPGLQMRPPGPPPGGLPPRLGGPPPLPPGRPPDGTMGPKISDEVLKALPASVGNFLSRLPAVNGRLRYLVSFCEVSRFSPIWITRVTAVKGRAYALLPAYLKLCGILGNRQARLAVHNAIDVPHNNLPQCCRLK